jgi:hypothetical protein
VTTVDDCRLVDLPRVHRAEGDITPVTGEETVPFKIARVYYLYDVPGGADRGGHAHRELHQLIICVMGSFQVTLDDAAERRELTLDRAYHGLHVPPMIWRDLHDFSAGAICLVLASMPFDERDYIRAYEEFESAKQSTDT